MHRFTFHSIYYKGRKGMKGRHNTRFNTDAHSSRSRNTRLFVYTYATRLSTIEVSTANANHPHQRLTRQLLCGSALLPHLPTLKLFSLPVESGASFLHVHGNATCLALIVHRQWGHALLVQEGGVYIVREIIASHVQAPLHFALRIRLQKGGVFAGH